MKVIAAKAQIFYAAAIKMGICVPSGCTKHDVSEILNYSKWKFDYCIFNNNFFNNKSIEKLLFEKIFDF